MPAKFLPICSVSAHEAVSFAYNKMWTADKVNDQVRTCCEGNDFVAYFIRNAGVYTNSRGPNLIVTDIIAHSYSGWVPSQNASTDRYRTAWCERHDITPSGRSHIYALIANPFPGRLFRGGKPAPAIYS